MIRLVLLIATLAWPVTRTHQELIDLAGRKGDVTHLYDLYQRAPCKALSEYATLAAAVAAAPSCLTVGDTVTLTANATFPAGMGLYVLPGGYFTGAYTLTVSGSFFAGLYKVFDTTTTAAFGIGAAPEIFPQWWGAVGNAVTNSTLAIQRAIDASKNSRANVRLVGGVYLTTSTLTFDNNRVSLEGDGPQNSILLFSESGPAIRIAPSGQREYCRIENIGITAGGADSNAAIDASNAPNSIIRGIYADNYRTGLVLGNSWNTSVSDSRFVGCRKYGIYATANTNAVAFVNVTLDGADSAGSRGLLLESSHAVAWKGGPIEDFEWAAEMQGSEFTFDGYLESLNHGCFIITGNESYLNILSAYIFNPGDSAVVRSTAGTAEVLANQIRLITPTTNPAYVFRMAGFASVTYGKLRADDAVYEHGGAQLASMVAGHLQRFTTPYRVTHYSNSANTSEIDGTTTAYAQKLNNPAGNSGLHIVAGNNNVNDGSEYLIRAQAGDGTDAFLVESGGRITLVNGPTITAGSAAPTDPEPNGSLYLRAGVGLYVREAGAWVAK